MPNGERIDIAPEDLYGTEITVQDYIDRLYNYLKRMEAFGAMDRTTTSTWFNYALRMFGYSSQEEFEAKSAQDTRIINPSEERQVLAPGETPPKFTQWFPWSKAPEYTMAMPEGFSSKQLPMFQQVIAPLTYRNAAINLATQYGYEEGSSQWNTLIRKGMQESDAFQLDYVNSWLKWNETAATSQKDYATAERARANQVKVWTFLSQQRMEAQEAEARAQAIEEGWAKQREAEFVGTQFQQALEQPPTMEKPVREFLEQERPGRFQEFVESRIPSVLGQFQRSAAGARSAWWQQINRPTYEEALGTAEMEASRWHQIWVGGFESGLRKELGVRAAKLGRSLTAQDVTPEEWALLQAHERYTAAQGRIKQLQGLTAEQIQGYEVGRGAEDPLKQYLAQYPWQAEWFKLSPRQRGYYPTQFAPSARWIT